MTSTRSRLASLELRNKFGCLALRLSFLIDVFLITGEGVPYRSGIGKGIGNGIGNGNGKGNDIGISVTVMVYYR